MNPLETALASARENFGFNRHNQQHMDKLRYVLAQQGPKRWRAAAELYLFLNPVSRKVDPETGQLIATEDARTISRHIAEEMARQRKMNDLAGKKFITSDDKNSGRVHALTMPVGLLQFIEMIDPDLYSGTPEERRKSLRLLQRTFPEYSPVPVERILF